MFNVVNMQRVYYFANVVMLGLVIVFAKLYVMDIALFVISTELPGMITIWSYGLNNSLGLAK
jgi:hypothetical protein